MDLSQGPDLLLSRPVVDLIAEAGGCSLARRLQFPDGSLCITEDCEKHIVFTELANVSNTLGYTACGTTTFRSLAPFTPCQYTLFYDAKYSSKFGEECMVVTPMPTHQELPSERALDRLSVFVEFRRSTTQDTIRQFSRMLSKWIDSVSRNGVFGEGPVQEISETVEFGRYGASFYFSASQTGPNTINWLILTVLNFGCDFATVDAIRLAGHVGKARKPFARPVKRIRIGDEGE